MIDSQLHSHSYIRAIPLIRVIRVVFCFYFLVLPACAENRDAVQIGTYMSWNPELHAYTLGEEGRKFAGVVGSPSAIAANPEFSSNSYSNPRSTFRLDPIQKGTAVKYIFIAGATNGPDQARRNYERL